MPDDDDKLMKGEDWTVLFDPEVLEKMKNDPELAEFVRGTIAQMRQALDGVNPKDQADVNARMSGAGFEKIIRDENGEPIDDCE